MKLLKKILPFATIASVATVGLTTMVGCSCEPTPTPSVDEYDLNVVEEDGIEINATKFMLHQPLAIAYKLVEVGGEIHQPDFDNSTIQIGGLTIPVSNFAIDTAKKIITVTADKVISPNITIDLKIQEWYTDEWVVGNTKSETIDAWKSRYVPQKSTYYSSTLATDEYLSDVVSNKKIFACDIARSYVESTVLPWSTLSKYSKIITVINDINALTWQCSFTIRLEGKQPSDSQTLIFKNVVYTLVWSQFQSQNVWIFAPLMFWLNNYEKEAEAPSTGTILYLQNDKNWSINHTTSTGSHVYNCNDERSNLENLLDYVAQYELSFLSKYAKPFF